MLSSISHKLAGPDLQSDHIEEHFGVVIFPGQVALPFVVDFGHIPDSAIAKLGAVDDFLDKGFQFTPHPFAVEGGREDALIFPLGNRFGHTTFHSFAMYHFSVWGLDFVL